MDAGNKKVFPKPSNGADIHSFRADYAKRVYNAHKREFDEFRNERLIVFKNRVVDSYTTKNGRKDENKFYHLYTDIDGRKQMHMYKLPLFMCVYMLLDNWINESFGTMKTVVLTEY